MTAACRAWLVVPALLLAACVRHNENYCADKPYHRCDGGIALEVPAEGGADRAADSARDGLADAAKPGCRTNTECRNTVSQFVCDSDAGVCVQCLTDGDCRTDGGSSVCDGTTHSCVACLPERNGCPTTLPVCEAKTCRTCRMDSECPPPQVCMADGWCAGDPDVVHLRNANTCPGADGSTAAPYCKAADAVAQLREGRRVLVVHGPVSVGALDLLDLTFPVVVVGKEDAVVVPGGGDLAGVHVSGAFSATIRDLTVTGPQVGILADRMAELHVDRCWLHDNMRGGIMTDQAGFAITSSLIVKNGAGDGGGGATFGGVRLGRPGAAGGPARFEFNTVADNLAPGVSCFSTDYAVSNSVVTRNTTTQATGCSFPICCTDAAGPSATDYSFAAGSACLNKVPATATTPLLDVHGHPRTGALDCGAVETTP